MTVVAATLWDAANGLADILKQAAEDGGYEMETCVTPVEPAWDCQRIHVWPAVINTQQIRCHAAPQVTLAYGIAACIGSGKDGKEPCTFWNQDDKTETALSMLWTVYGGLLDAFNPAPQGQGTLCEALGGTPCAEVVIGPLNTFESADFVIYGGTVTFRLDVVLIAS